MNGLGEDVYIDRSAALDELTAESQRLGLYGDAPDVEAKLIETVTRAVCRGKHDRCHRDGHPCAIGDACVWWMGNAESYRAALESLGISLSVLAAIRAGKWVAVPKVPTGIMLCAGAMGMRDDNAPVTSVYERMVFAAPKTPEAAR